MDRFADSLVIIIVIYKRSLEDCESFQSILAMRTGDSNLNIFVYDNSPTSQKIKNYEGLTITYFHDKKNSGVGKAYNVGVEHANNAKKKWVLLLDQDTSLPDIILEKYNQAIEANSDINLFVPVLKLKNGRIFSPSRYRFKRGFFVDNIKPGTHTLFEYAPVNSGMVVRVEAFVKVGGYNERVKLDFADFQFVERLRKSFSTFFVLDVECEQDFSDEDGSCQSQSVRFKFFCEGAKNIDDKSIWDWLQYNTVVFIRAVRLSLRFGKLSFMGSYFKNFLFASKAKN